MFDVEFLEQMTYRGELRRWSASNLYGIAEYATPVPFPCYWAEKQSESESEEGSDREASGTLYLPPPAFWYEGDDGPSPTTDDVVNLPNGKEAKIVEVETLRDEDGEYGSVVKYG